MEPKAGRRVHPEARGAITFAAGDYGRTIHGEWVVRPPGCLFYTVPQDQVTEHEDGTITVAQPILVEAIDPRVKDARPRWHGTLELGVWKPA